MKAHLVKRFGAVSTLVSLLTFGTACGAAPVPKGAQEAAPSAVSDNPEMQHANDRVQKAEAQLELAKKQLTAARSLLKAAEADLKAARADRNSVAVRYQAQGLAEEAGLPVQAGRAMSQSVPNQTQVADRGTLSGNQNAPTQASGGTDSTGNSGYNSLPQTESDPPTPVQLR